MNILVAWISYVTAIAMVLQANEALQAHSLYWVVMWIAIAALLVLFGTELLIAGANRD